MALGRIYIYDKLTRQEQDIGELQFNFNMSLTIDETPNSSKITILSTLGTFIAPNTILRIGGFEDLWWVVKSDRYIYHNNENGALYEHELELKDAFDILNSRDLISCGFNTDRYTIRDFLERLFRLSDFEYQLQYIDYGDILDPNQKVNYLKTFENYTPASAIREFLNGYNCIPRLSFSVRGGFLEYATLKIYSKSGFDNGNVGLELFDQVEEQGKCDSESFATRVISNVQNCVAKSPIKYPSIGACQLVGDNGQITYSTSQSAKILLPTPAYYVESITFYVATRIALEYGNNYREIIVQPDDISRNGRLTKNIIAETLSNWGVSQTYINNFINNWGTAFETLKPQGIFTLRNGGYYDITNEQQSNKEPFLRIDNVNNPNDVYVFLNNDRYSYNDDGQYHFMIRWKQNSNEISGFGFYEALQRSGAGAYFSANVYTNTKQIYNQNNIKITSYSNSNFITLLDNRDNSQDVFKTLYSVNYIPMTDLKVKTDNAQDYNDSKLYNQNGKLVDGYSVGKLINGYCESVKSGEITRNKMYYDFNDIPKVGQRVANYVISNVSIDIVNSELGVIYDCQFTLNEYSACKSTMISANTSIRDYECPQENNIKRIQNYRDYIELDYQLNSTQETYYNLSKLLNFSTNSIGFANDCVAMLRANDEEFYNQNNSSSNYYYRLTHTIYNLANKVVVDIDCGDNNIIGYGNKETYKPFQFRNFFDREKSVNVPISYVNSKGELRHIEVILTELENVENAYGDLFINDTCAIPPSIYNNCYNYSVLKLTETNYMKDGLEVPVFLYSAEIGGNNGIVVAEDFFEYGENYSDLIIVKYNQAEITKDNYMVAYNQLEDYFVVREIRIVDRTIIISVYSMPTNKFKGDNIGLYARKGNQIRFLFSMNKYPKSSNNITIFANTYKLK